MVSNIQDETFKIIKPFLANCPTLNLQKTRGNQGFSDFFKKYKVGILSRFRINKKI